MALLDQMAEAIFCTVNIVKLAIIGLDNELPVRMPIIAVWRKFNRLLSEALFHSSVPT